MNIVTVYAFSIENFKRAESEVAALMDLAKRGFEQLLDQRRVFVLGMVTIQSTSFSTHKLTLSLLSSSHTIHSELIQKHQVCVRVLGDVSLLPNDVQIAIAKCVNLSRTNKR